MTELVALVDGEGSFTTLRERLLVLPSAGRLGLVSDQSPLWLSSRPLGAEERARRREPTCTLSRPASR